MRKPLVICAVFLVLVTTLGASRAAHAASSENVIQDGLWKGYNLVFGGSSPATTPTTPATAPHKKIYAALGDSVAAGLGLPDDSSANAAICGRSSQAYSTAVGKSVGLPVVNLACSGATAGDIYTKQAATGLPAQLTAAYAAGQPQLLTITAGANDVRWASLIKACYAYDCTQARYTNAAAAYRLSLQAKLLTAFAAIDAKPGAAPRTIITGYYNPLSASCSQLQTAVTPQELNWIAYQTDALNRTIQQAAANYGFVSYAPVDFSGHDICSTDSWVQGLADSAPLHPTTAGQQAIAAAVTSIYQQ